MNIFDRLLLHVIRRRLARPEFFDAVGNATLAHWRASKAAETAERERAAHEAVRVLAKRLEIQRLVSDSEGYTQPSPLQ